jgi:hypothetical protein
MIPEYIQEDFGFTPFNLKEVDRVEGKALYSSPRLKAKYLEAISGQAILRPVVRNIEALLQKDIIVPCYTSSNLFGVLKHKLTGTNADKQIMGFYSPINNKVYILFDNRLKFLAWANNDDLSLVTIHELMHYVAKNNKRNFYNTFKGELIAFYRAFYSDFAGVQLDVRQVELMVVGAIKMFEWEEDVTGNTINKYRHYLDRIVTLLDPEQKKMVVDVPLENAALYWKNPNMFLNKAKTDKETNRLVFALWRAYDRVFGLKNPNTFPIQEILFPSEVISISSEKPTSNHYKAVKSIG